MQGVRTMEQQWTVQNFMSSLPRTISVDQSLKKAMDIMQEHQIRHLPVLEGKKLVGVLTERDIAVARNFQGSAELRVDGVMMPMTYSTRPETPLEEVAKHMAEHKYGSVVVQNNAGEVVGIFTALDALRALSEIIRGEIRLAS
jgi:acetoin utilization protein AcuB